MTQEEKVFRQRLVDEMHRGEKTVVQIQQELADYLNPDTAELRRYREREPLVRKLACLLGRIDWDDFDCCEVTRDAIAVRDFKMAP